MKITDKEISEYKQNRDKFNTYYKNAVLDILVLKHNYKMNIQELQDSTSYDINFIVHVIKNYNIHTQIDNEDSYNVSVLMNKNNINIEKLKKDGYNDAFIAEVLNPSEEGTKYYSPIFN